MNITTVSHHVGSFVIVFFPIVPPAKKRVIEQCAACRRHAAPGFLDIDGGVDRIARPCLKKPIRAGRDVERFGAKPEG